MPRVQIELPEHYSFSTELTVYIGHINAGQHLDNAMVLSLVSEARARYFRALGYTEDNVEGLVTTMADMAVMYRSEGYYGDLLLFELAATDFNKYGCDLMFRITRKSDGTEVARGKNGLVFIQRDPRRIAQMPASFEQRARVGLKPDLR